MSTIFDTAQAPLNGVVSNDPLRIYAGVLGQIGDIIMYSATLRRLRQVFPRGRITCVVSEKYRAAGELLQGLPYVDRLFVTRHYFEKMTDALHVPWHLGWPVDLRGEDEIFEQARHDVVLETRPRHRRMPWWEFDHQVAELAHSVGVPGPIDRQTEIAIPPGTKIPVAARDKFVLHNDPSIDTTKAWPWDFVRELAQSIGAGQLVLLGTPGPDVEGTLDLRGKTTLAEAAAIIGNARCYVGIDSGLMWIAASLQVPTVGLYGTSYIPAYRAIHPVNANAQYLQADGTLDQIRPGSVQKAISDILFGSKA